MIKNAVLGKEISVIVGNKPGGLSEIAKFLVDHGINVEAIAGYVKDNGVEAELLFVTDNNYDAIETLNEHGYGLIKEREVIVVEVENKPGALKNITEMLAQNNINLEYIYGTTCMGGCPAKIVFSTDDNVKAAGIFRC